MNSNLLTPYEYVETEVCETLSLSVACVGLKPVHYDGARYLRLEFFRRKCRKAFTRLDLLEYNQYEDELITQRETS
jgi:hypothetical protein